jgi:molybdopterin-guanine dinucleotide biosynthesis protein A
MGGINKALLEVGGRPLVERVASVLRSIFARVVIITNTPQDFLFLDLPLHADLRPGCGALGGLYTGLKVTGCDYGFLAACDMPFLNPAIINCILSHMNDHDVIIPRVRERLEPLHAVYAKSCLPHIETLLDKDILRILDLFPRVQVEEVPEHEITRLDAGFLFALNLNTPEDLRRARELAKYLPY